MAADSPQLTKLQQTVDVLQHTVNRLEQTVTTMLHFVQAKFSEQTAFNEKQLAFNEEVHAKLVGHDKRFDIAEVQQEKTHAQIKQLGEQMNWRMDQLLDAV